MQWLTDYRSHGSYGNCSSSRPEPPPDERQPRTATVWGSRAMGLRVAATWLWHCKPCSGPRCSGASSPCHSSEPYLPSSWPPAPCHRDPLTGRALTKAQPGTRPISSPLNAHTHPKRIQPHPRLPCWLFEPGQQCLILPRWTYGCRGSAAQSQWRSGLPSWDQDESLGWMASSTGRRLMFTFPV